MVAPAFGRFGVSHSTGLLEFPMPRPELAEKTVEMRVTVIKEPTMLSLRKSISALVLASTTALAGCASDHKPEGYDRQRPDVTEVNTRDRGLQSSEVVEASEKLATKL